MTNHRLIFGTGASAAKSINELNLLVEEAITDGITSFDTAPSYHTERILSEAIKNAEDKKLIERGNIYIQSKIDAWQMEESNGEIQKYVEKALEMMEIDYLDALLIHWPIPEYLDMTWKSMMDLQKRGIVKKIGICNVRIRHLKSMMKWDEFPSIIQIERNPLRICEDERQFCLENQIELQAYSPLCKMDDRIKNNPEIQKIANKYNLNVGQIVMRWHLDTEVSPIFTSTKPFSPPAHLLTSLNYAKISKI